MKKDRCLAYLFGGLGVLLSDVMCAAVAYNYCTLQWCGKYAGCSAPANTAFLLCFPYGVGIAVCAVLARFFHKRRQQALH